MLVCSGSGGWDVTGVTAVNDNDTFITCRSVHLTSFAVLVDVSGTSTRVIIVIRTYKTIRFSLYETFRVKLKALHYLLSHISAVESLCFVCL